MSGHPVRDYAIAFAAGSAFCRALLQRTIGDREFERGIALVRARLDALEATARMSDSAHAVAQRERVAYHEAGHAVIAHLLGQAVDLVSILPIDTHSGICQHSASLLKRDIEALGTVPAPLLPASARRGRRCRS